MRYLISTIALLGAVAGTASAQQMDHSKDSMHADSAHAMKTQCPLHMDSLALTPAQQVVVDSVLAKHELVMKKLMPKHDAMAAGHDMKAKPKKMSERDHETMERSMQAATMLIRDVLDVDQRMKFDVALITHEAEMKALKESGDHDCMECCMACLEHADMLKSAAARRP